VKSTENMFRIAVKLIVILVLVFWVGEGQVRFSRAGRRLATNADDKIPTVESEFTIDTTGFPGWLTHYIRWHNIVRSDPELFKKMKVLIVNEGVGGLGDRLKHLPYYLWLASKHDRVLLIHWNTECGISEYFQPNLINWITPPELLEKSIHLNKKRDLNDYFNHLIDDAEMETRRSDLVLQVFGNHLSQTKGQPQLVAAANNNKRIFKFIYQALFRLADPVQELLEKTKKQIGLSDNYIGVHLRARYPGINKVLDAAGEHIDSQGITQVTEEVRQEIDKLSSHAIECTRTAAGGNDAQVYFASDTLLAMELQHQKDNNVVYMRTDQERIHFGQSHEKKCEKFYPAIVDLWLLSQAKCIGFGVGGYGALATMMSDFECWTIHQWNSMLNQQFAKQTNFFNGPDGNLPECLLPSRSQPGNS
jgi:hypothetical protein